MKKRRNKPYRPRETKIPLILGNQHAFAPLDLFLHRMRAGTVEDAIEQGDGDYMGVVVPSIGRTHCHTAHDLLMLFGFFIKRLGETVGRQLDTSDFFAMAERLKYGFDVDDRMLSSVERLTATGQAIGATLTYARNAEAVEQAVVDKEEYLK